MRRPTFRLRWSATVVLLVVNVVAFILQNALDRFSGFPTNRYLALSVEGLRHGYVWQLLTYQFLHGGWLHLLLNCWAIFVFGREVEEDAGPEQLPDALFYQRHHRRSGPGAGRAC